MPPCAPDRDPDRAVRAPAAPCASRPPSSPSRFLLEVRRNGLRKPFQTRSPPPAIAAEPRRSRGFRARAAGRRAHPANGADAILHRAGLDGAPDAAAARPGPRPAGRGTRSPNRWSLRTIVDWFTRSRRAIAWVVPEFGEAALEDAPLHRLEHLDEPRLAVGSDRARRPRAARQRAGSRGGGAAARASSRPPG